MSRWRQRLPYWLKAGGIGAAGALVALLVIAAVLGLQGIRFTLSDAVLTTLIVSVTTVVVALLNRTREHAKAAREQVENNHTTNLREESDERHNENAGLLLQIANDVGGLRSDFRQLGRRVDHLYDLEITHPRTPKKGRHA